MKQVRIGTRDSVLALKQTDIVVAAIKACDPSVRVDVMPMKTTGDLIQSRFAAVTGNKGDFTRELDQALLRGMVDLCVHSLKDLPFELCQGVCFAAIGAREDPRDALILPGGMDKPPPGKPFGSSSQRRKIQLEKLYPGCRVEPVRGNILTRLEKLDRGEYAALALATAGLKRLGLEQRIHKIFTREQMIPACGQGMLAVTARYGEAHPYLKDFHNTESWDIAQCERIFLRTLGGNCSTPMAAHATIRGDKITLSGFTVDKQGRMIPGRFTGERSRALSLGVSLATYLKVEAESVEE